MVIEKNVKYLNDRVKMTGFGEIYEAEIRENISKGLDSFTINVKRDFGDQDYRDTTESVLHFNKGKEDWYHFNSYDTRITNRPDDVAASTWETVKVDHKFKKNTYTLKEMYNLKLGGSVEKEISYMKKNEETGKEEEISFTGFRKADHRELTKYKSYPKKNIAWPLMEKQLRDSHALKLLKDPDLADGLVRSMKKGNVQRVTLKNGETEIVRWIAIDAEFKKIGIYESNPRVYISNEEALAKKQAAAERQLAAGQVETQADLAQPPAATLNPDNPAKAHETKVVPLYPDGSPAKTDLPKSAELPSDAAGKNSTSKAETEKPAAHKAADRVQQPLKQGAGKTKGKNHKTTPVGRKKAGHKV
ncbi:hypothetical protein PV783_25015 [Chitinophaga sp. CC14]|uniref:hypothetical protein n=1 Tax=Chitinophaga sp. CC14 TaxID=3029199 RepID=UPI003B7EC292